MRSPCVPSTNRTSVPHGGHPCTRPGSPSGRESRSHISVLRPAWATQAREHRGEPSCLSLHPGGAPAETGFECGPVRPVRPSTGDPGGVRPPMHCFTDRASARGAVMAQFLKQCIGAGREPLDAMVSAGLPTHDEAAIAELLDAEQILGDLVEDCAFVDTGRRSARLDRHHRHGSSATPVGHQVRRKQLPRRAAIQRGEEVDDAEQDSPTARKWQGRLKDGLVQRRHTHAKRRRSAIRSMSTARTL